jgi:GntR family transcriptional regulator/MocR family aminotransferase
VWTKLFAHFEAGADTRQAQLRAAIVHGILSGIVPPNMPIPPSRALAALLGVSRNTIVLALQSLIERDFLISRSRSGLYVNPAALDSHAGIGEAAVGMGGGHLRWAKRFRFTPTALRNIVKPVDWQSFPYPFIYGQFDEGLMPVVDWRECEQQALHRQTMRAWSRDYIDKDVDPLIEQIHRRLLPARGIWAARSEILVTVGAQMAIFLLSQLLLDRSSVVGLEEPGYPDARNVFALRARAVVGLPVDAQGLRVGPEVARCDYVYVTPSHQCPTTVTLSPERRERLIGMARKRDMVIFEDDHESELNFSGRPSPALKSLDSDGRVIYIGSLSKTLSHGLRIGFVVAPTEVIRELRVLRRLVMRHPPSNNAYSAARFIGQGYHDAFIRRLNRTYRARRKVLLEALNEFLPGFEVSTAIGGSAVWVRAPARIDTDQLARSAAAEGVIIEPGSVFFARPPSPCRHFRMGYSAIQEASIRDGVRELARHVPTHTVTRALKRARQDRTR